MRWRDLRFPVILFLGCTVVQLFPTTVKFVFDGEFEVRNIYSALLIGAAITLGIVSHFAAERMCKISMSIPPMFCLAAGIFAFAGIYDMKHVWFETSLLFLALTVWILYRNRTFKTEEILIIGDHIFPPGVQVSTFYNIMRGARKGAAIDLYSMKIGGVHVNPYQIEIDGEKLARKNQIPRAFACTIASEAGKVIRDMFQIETNGAVKITSPGAKEFEVCGGIPVRWSGRAAYSAVV